MGRANDVRDRMHNLYLWLLKTVMKRREAIGALNTVADRILDKQEKVGLKADPVAMLTGVTTKGGSGTWLQS